MIVRSDRPQPRSAIQLELADGYAEDAAQLKHEMNTHKANLERLFNLYGDTYPNLAGNYSLMLMLYLRDVGRVRLDPNDIQRAAVLLGKGFPNLTSVHRAFTDVKKRHETPEQRAEDERKAQLYRDWAIGAFDSEDTIP